MSQRRGARGASRSAGLNYLLTSVGWRQDHNGYSHQMPGFINSMLNRKEDTARVYLPPDANTLLATMEQVPRVHAHDQPRDRLQAPAAPVAVDGRGARARREGRVASGSGPAATTRRPGHRARRLRHDPDDRAARRGRACCARTCRSCACASSNVTDLFTLARPEAHPHGHGRGGRSPSSSPRTSPCSSTSTATPRRSTS